jgi:6-phosphogluconate dehydrogenase
MDLKLTGDTTMEVGLVGTGPMARHMAQRLADGGHRVLVFDPRGGAGAPMATRGVTHFASLEALRFELTSPRAWWLALPAQGASEALWGELASLLEPGDTLVDGAESDYRDSQRRAADLAQRRIGFVDCGIRGPMPGEDPGYRMLLGGRTDVIRALRPILETLAPARGRRWGRVGASGAGHFARTQLFGQDLRPMSSHAQNQP